MSYTKALLGSMFLLFAGCGGAAETCTTAMCGTGGKSYQTCATAGSTKVTYKTDTDCTCDAAVSMDCNTCAMKVAAFCK